MNIPCALCKNNYKRAGIESATIKIPFCSKCWDDYADVLDFAYEKAVETIDDYWEGEGPPPDKIELDALPTINSIANFYSDGLVKLHDYYLSGLFLKYAFTNKIIGYSHEELLYFVIKKYSELYINKV